MQHKDICPQSGVEMRIKNESTATNASCEYITIDGKYSYQLTGKWLISNDNLSKWYYQNGWQSFYTYHNGKVYHTELEYEQAVGITKLREDLYFQSLEKDWDKIKNSMRQRVLDKMISDELMEHKTINYIVPSVPLKSDVQTRIVPDVPKEDLESFGEGLTITDSEWFTRMWTRFKTWFTPFKAFWK